MNYIWELAVHAIQQQVHPNAITFRKGRPFSPYMELCPDFLNETGLTLEADMNPYYRFHDMFHELFPPDEDEWEELRAAVFDLTVHHLLDIDLLMGMNRREYHINFVRSCVQAAYFGEFARDRIGVFSIEEQKIIVNNLIILYNTGESIHLLKDTVSRIFENTYIFANAYDRDEIILFLRTNETRKRLDKIEVIRYLFLPVNYTLGVYWENIFGVIGVPEMMRIGSIVNY